MNDLYDVLSDEIDSVEYADGGSMVKSTGVNVGLNSVKGNPSFVSQFDLNATIVYSNITGTRAAATDTWTVSSAAVLPAALPAAAQNDIAVFLFGQADSMGGYKRNNQLFPLTNWVYNQTKVVDSLSTEYDLNQSSFNWDSYARFTGAAARGDSIQSYVYEVTKTATAVDIYVAEVVIECKQVAYGTLLDATNSDRFIMNMIRYKISDTTKTAQYEKQLRVIKQSLFGKLSTDDVSPAAFQDPRQFQTNIVDIPIVKGIDKQSSIGTYLNYDVGEILFSIFVQTQKKVQA